jgi:hypothetical protein
MLSLSEYGYFVYKRLLSKPMAGAFLKGLVLIALHDPYLYNLSLLSTAMAVTEQEIVWKKRFVV